MVPVSSQGPLKVEEGHRREMERDMAMKELIVSTAVLLALKREGGACGQSNVGSPSELERARKQILL